MHQDQEDQKIPGGAPVEGEQRVALFSLLRHGAIAHFVNDSRLRVRSEMNHEMSVVYSSFPREVEIQGQ